MGDLQARLQSRDADEAALIARLEEDGTLEHLRGKPLELDDDPDYLAARFLKGQGFTHPLLERARDLDEPRAAAEATLERLRRRRDWLASAEAATDPEDAEEFNRWRLEALELYRDRLQTVNRAVRDYNLAVPDVLQQRPVQIEPALRQAEECIPPLDPASLARPARRHWWQREVRR